MDIAVLSGKGGTGKTFVSVNLATAASHAVYVDCDVEEPNGRLFLKPQGVDTEEVFRMTPVFNEEKCIGCRRCVDFCHFNALVFLRNKPLLFPDVCHSCGGCAIVCPVDAVNEIRHPVGVVESGISGSVDCVTGVLNLGEASGVPVITGALKKGRALARSRDSHCIIDCPPGSACTVHESVNGADYCILVVEPTAFGFHNFLMVHELVSLLDRPCGVVINKQDEPFGPLEEYCREHNIPVLLRIPYSDKIAGVGAAGEIPSRKNPQMMAMFSALLERIEGEVR